MRQSHKVKYKIYNTNTDVESGTLIPERLIKCKLIPAIVLEQVKRDVGQLEVTIRKK